MRMTTYSFSHRLTSFTYWLLKISFTLCPLKTLFSSFYPIITRHSSFTFVFNPPLYSLHSILFLSTT